VMKKTWIVVDEFCRPIFIFTNLTIYCQSKKDRWTMARSCSTNVKSKAKLLVYTTTL
jgi:hypothetical protein